LLAADRKVDDNVEREKPLRSTPLYAPISIVDTDV
jgi:hypothetical protein